MPSIIPVIINSNRYYYKYLVLHRITFYMTYLLKYTTFLQSLQSYKFRLCTDNSIFRYNQILTYAYIIYFADYYFFLQIYFYLKITWYDLKYSKKTLHLFLS